MRKRRACRSLTEDPKGRNRGRGGEAPRARLAGGGGSGWGDTARQVSEQGAWGSAAGRALGSCPHQPVPPQPRACPSGEECPAASGRWGSASWGSQPACHPSPLARWPAWWADWTQPLWELVVASVEGEEPRCLPEAGAGHCGVLPLSLWALERSSWPEPGVGTPELGPDSPLLRQVPFSSETVFSPGHGPSK